MAKKKILIATDQFLPKIDGLTMFLSEIIPRLKDKYDITVIGPDYGEIEIQGVRIIKFPLLKLRMGDFFPTKFSLKTIREEVKNTDIVFLQSTGPIGGAAVIYAKRYSKPIVAYMHIIEWEVFCNSLKRFRFPVKIISKFYARFFYNKCSLLMSPFLEFKEILKKSGITKPETVVVQLGVDTKRFVPTEDKKKAKEKIGLSPDRLVIGYVGRIAREKDLLTLLDAFNKLQASWDNITLLIVGGGVKEVEDKFKEARNASFMGFQKDVVPYMQAMDIFVLPSLTETTSLVTIEAMSCGLPVVVTPVGFIKRYIKERENGLFFPKKNSTVLKLKLDLLLKNPVLRYRIGKRARKTVEDTFTWDKTVKDIEIVLEQF